jgi:hypothetical protein
MGMNELELSEKLGFLSDPECNRVPLEGSLQGNILFLKKIFKVLQNQKSQLGSFNPELWCELVPWHSLN